MRKISWLILSIFIILLAGFIGSVAYITSATARNFIDGSGIGPIISGWGTGVGYSITTNPFWLTYIGPNAFIIFGAITAVFGALTYRYVYEKGIRERAIRDAFDSRASTSVVTTSPSPAIAATRPDITAESTPQPQPEVKEEPKT